MIEFTASYTLADNVYETLFDVDSIVSEIGSIELVNERRRKQLEYTWLLTLMGRYESLMQFITGLHEGKMDITIGLEPKNLQ